MSLKIENWKLLVLSIFYVIFSILSYMITRDQFLNFFMIAGILLALVGLFQILVYFFKKEYMKPNEYSFAFGILYAIAGLIVASKPDVIVDNYPIVISGLIVLDSTLRLQYSMNLFRLQNSQWKVNALLAVVPLLLGMVLILVDMEEGFLHNYFSFLLILDAIANFYTVIYYKKIVKEFTSKGYDMVKNEEQEVLDVEEVK
ncbi:MAG: DUF308 domain-containing protein [Longicatena sp.]